MRVRGRGRGRGRVRVRVREHAPDCARPEKNWLIILAVRSGPQFITTHWRASALARSLVVSVLPVPAGPAGAPPMPRLSAPVSVM